MKAILLAAQNEERLYPFTQSRPAALLPLGDRTLLHHALTHLPRAVDALTVVVDAEVPELVDNLRAAQSALPIEVIPTPCDTTFEVLPTLFDESLALVLNAHDLHDVAELESIIGEPSLLLSGMAGICGVGALREDDAWLSLAAACLTRASYEEACAVGGSIMMSSLLVTDATAFRSLRTERWRPMLYPWNILEANVDWVRSLTASRIEGTVDPGVHIEGLVVIETGTHVKSGTRIEGPVYIGRNCVIGPSAYLRPDTVIGDGCTLGHAAEVYDTVLFPGTTAKHRCYLGHSVIGAGVNIGCGCITSDYRHDAGQHMTVVSSRKVQTGRTKLGAFIGDGVRTGIQTLLYPGRKLGAFATTLPGQIVDRDIGID